MTDPATSLNNTVGAYFIGCTISSMLRAAPKIAFLCGIVGGKRSTPRRLAAQCGNLSAEHSKRLSGLLDQYEVMTASINNNIIVSDNENKGPIPKEIGNTGMIVTLDDLWWAMLYNPASNRELNVRNRFRKRHYHEGNILVSINSECQEMPPDLHAEREIELENIPHLAVDLPARRQTAA
ncbi:hypothetical protein POSPLADRAFT_1049111 [Postia placenta MAD-698-R-SB12]|uniref:Uncharacterized protein n=1 Tax=Postia placenta MAD-698-R-SB12 TaxID=670580 RepID=A0A1X6MRF0_9APHY|nr:hypothetical protein POSPLADRAFT_1049111 [Postia placenta MAD-698-R-SB12]OSX58958.1 hypothetical protein POSPLADRAFT_1049111 [Postia placenta MAD-698-R-SB12]